MPIIYFNGASKTEVHKTFLRGKKETKENKKKLAKK